jgi:uncharacterized protein HemX
LFQPEAQTTVSTNTLGVWLALLTFVAAISAPIIGYVITTTRGYIKGVSDAAKERNETIAKEIAAAESRCMAQIRDTECRAEKGDERILAHVNSQYAEINAQLRDIRDSLLHSAGAKQ